MWCNLFKYCYGINVNSQTQTNLIEGCIAIPLTEKEPWKVIHKRIQELADVQQHKDTKLFRLSFEGQVYVTDIES